MDVGIATEDNLAELRKRGYHWITVKRGGVEPDQVDGVCGATNWVDSPGIEDR